MELEVKPKGEPGQQELKKSLEQDLGSACGPKRVSIL